MLEDCSGHFMKITNLILSTTLCSKYYYYPILQIRKEREVKVTTLVKSTARISIQVAWLMGFLGSSDGKEAIYNAEDPGSIPGLGRSRGEGIGYSLQYSWASLVAQMVKDFSAMQETWV